MKNKDKYAKEILEIACDGGSIAVDKKSENLSPCFSISCSNCLFYIPNEGICNYKKKRKWAESEYIEKPVISKRDRAFLEYLDKKYEYIARDENRCLMTYEHSVTKGEDGWNYDFGAIKSLSGLDVQFPMVKWSDSKPWLIEDLKKLEVVKNYE